MKIIDLKLYPIGSRLLSGSVSPHIIVKLITDEGPIGLGEMSRPFVSAIVPDVDYLEGALKKALLGADPFEPARIDPVVDRFPTPLGAGIDMAIHDLGGKSWAFPFAISTAAPTGNATESATLSSGSRTPRKSIGMSNVWVR